MAATEEVITTRVTPALIAAPTTRTAPSRAGLIRSSGFFGGGTPSGEATCSTYWVPSMAASQPSSLVRLAAWTLRRLPGSTCLATMARTSPSRRRSRTVVRTA